MANQMRSDEFFVQISGKFSHHRQQSTYDVRDSFIKPCTDSFADYKGIFESA